MAGDADDFHRMQSLFKQPGGSFVSEIMPAQVFDLQFGEGVFPDVTDRQYGAKS